MDSIRRLQKSIINFLSISPSPLSLPKKSIPILRHTLLISHFCLPISRQKQICMSYLSATSAFLFLDKNKFVCQLEQPCFYVLPLTVFC